MLALLSCRSHVYCVLSFRVFSRLSGPFFSQISYRRRHRRVVLLFLVDLLLFSQVTVCFRCILLRFLARIMLCLCHHVSFGHSCTLFRLADCIGCGCLRSSARARFMGSLSSRPFCSRCSHSSSPWLSRWSSR